MKRMVKRVGTLARGTPKEKEEEEEKGKEREKEKEKQKELRLRKYKKLDPNASVMQERTMK